MLLLLIIAIFNSMVAGQRPYIRSDANTGLVLVIFVDLMFLIGLCLWYFGMFGYQQLAQDAGGMSAAMKNPFERFWGIEHSVGMLVAIILVHIGKAQGKRKISDRQKHVRTMVFYLIALVIMLVTIPWPFRDVVGAGRGWY